MPKLDLDENNDTNSNEESDIISTHSHSSNCEQEKTNNRSSATQRNTTLSTINEGLTESEKGTPKTDI